MEARAFTVVIEMVERFKVGEEYRQMVLDFHMDIFWQSFSFASDGSPSSSQILMSRN